MRIIPGREIYHCLVSLLKKHKHEKYIFIYELSLIPHLKTGQTILKYFTVDIQVFNHLSSVHITIIFNNDVIDINNNEIKEELFKISSMIDNKDYLSEIETNNTIKTLKERIKELEEELKYLKEKENTKKL